MKDIYEKDNRLYVHVRNGKGGKEREVPILREFQERVSEIVKKVRDKGKERLFERIPSRIDVHSYRREYAKQRYREIRGKEYKKGQEIKRIEKAVREVSRNLGHNRENVTV
ncbi:hypothetical protein TheetDRAFT_3220, partial [Thermoanaerobacter ethanolicus JW 200]